MRLVRTSRIQAASDEKVSNADLEKQVTKALKEKLGYKSLIINVNSTNKGAKVGVAFKLTEFLGTKSVKKTDSSPELLDFNKIEWEVARAINKIDKKFSDEPVDRSTVIKVIKNDVWIDLVVWIYRS